MNHLTGADRHVWLDVRIDGITNITSLPHGLQVDTLGVVAGRENFKVLEGIRKDKKGSVKLTPAGQSQFGLVTLKPPALVVFSLSAGKVTFVGQSINAITDPSNPVPQGLWSLQIPDERHTLYGNGYLGQSPHATTWFRIGDGRDRYLHPGAVSAGCVTVTEVLNWSLLWQYLVLARKGDGMNVGTIQVVR